MSFLVALLFVAGGVCVLVTAVQALSHLLVHAVVSAALAGLLLGWGIVVWRKVRWSVPAGHVWAWVAALVGMLFLVSIMIPAFLCYRKDARRSLCVNNMRLIDHAKEVLAIKNGWTSGHVIAESPEEIWKMLDPFVDGTNVLCCPKAPGQHYIYGAIEETQKCPVVDKYKEHVYEPD